VQGQPRLAWSNRTWPGLDAPQPIAASHSRLHLGQSRPQLARASHTWPGLGPAAPNKCHVSGPQHQQSHEQVLDGQETLILCRLDQKAKVGSTWIDAPTLNCHNRHSKSILSVTKRRLFIPRLRGGLAAPPNRHTGQNRRKQPTFNHLRSKDQNVQVERRWITRPATPPHPAAPVILGPRDQPTSLT
jgi:hypothetical protein